MVPRLLPHSQTIEPLGDGVGMYQVGHGVLELLAVASNSVAAIELVAQRRSSREKVMYSEVGLILGHPKL